MANGDRRFLVEVNGVGIDIAVGANDVQVGERRLSFTMHYLSEGWYHLILDGTSYSVYLEPDTGSDGAANAAVNGKQARVTVRTERDLLLERFGLDAGHGVKEKLIRAPMPGLVVETLVQEGTTVRKGDGLLVLEAMKMENEIRSAVEGVVKLLHVKAGDAVTKNDLLVELE